MRRRNDGDRRGRHHPSRSRCHRQCRQQLAARRWRRRRCDPPRRRSGPRRGMPHAPRLQNRRRQDHPRLSPAGAPCHPHGRSGVAGRRPRRGRSPRLVLPRITRAGGRSPAGVDRLSGDLDGDLSLPRRSRCRDCGRDRDRGASGSAGTAACRVLLLRPRRGGASRGGIPRTRSEVALRSTDA